MKHAIHHIDHFVASTEHADESGCTGGRA